MEIIQQFCIQLGFANNIIVKFYYAFENITEGRNNVTTLFEELGHMEDDPSDKEMRGEKTKKMLNS
jgi:hypothetical protein